MKTALLALSLALAGCMNTPAKVVSTATLAVKEALCVLEHDTELPEQIIVDCDLPKAVLDEVTVLSQASMAAKRRAAAKR